MLNLQICIDGLFIADIWCISPRNYYSIDSDKDPVWLPQLDVRASDRSSFSY